MESIKKKGKAAAAEKEKSKKGGFIDVVEVEFEQFLRNKISLLQDIQ
jgi:hypothetical protein